MTPRPLICYFPATDRLAGAPRSVFNFMRSLDPTRFRPVFVSQVESPLSEMVQAAGIEMDIVPFPELLRAPRSKVVGRSLAAQIRTARAVTAYGRQVEAVARRVGSYGFWVRGMDSALLVGSAARRLRQPMLIDIDAELRPTGPLRLGYWYAAWRAAAVVLQDTRHLELTLGAGMQALQRNVHVLPPGIPAERVADALAIPRPAPDPARFTILVPASIHSRKNQLMLLEAIVPLVQRHPGLRVQLAGPVAETDYEEKLLAFARDRLPEGTVEFLGWREDVPVLMRQADLVVLTSIREGIPHALREAMHVEVPVVATAVGGVPDIVIDGETGYLVPSNDVEALRRTLERCMDDPEGQRRMAARARDFVHANFSFEAWAKRYDELLRQVLAGGA